MLYNQACCQKLLSLVLGTYFFYILKTSIPENAQENTATNETLIGCKKNENRISELASTDEILVHEIGCRSNYFVCEASDNRWFFS